MKYKVINESNNSEVAEFQSLTEACDHALKLWKENRNTTFHIKDESNQVISKIGLILG